MNAGVLGKGRKIGVTIRKMNENGVGAPEVPEIHKKRKKKKKFNQIMMQTPNPKLLSPNQKESLTRPA